MTDQTIHQTEAGTTKLGTIILNVALVIIGIGVLAVNATRIYQALDTSLPSCTASNIEKTVLAIARGEGVAGPKLSGARQSAEAVDQRTCSATLTNAAGATSQVTYRIYRNDAGRTEVAAQWNRI
ncbi:hypothetical protein [Phreatobacter sp.]|uniref:hypothetical protein n=1 Tax=Phreatobacter sp. TaxID=1966341 RepID=UPI003F70FFEC